ncbi:MAG: ribose 5-phosphate isomerase B [Saprospiraceae bacterium]|nr:ribose 5-phosphate isomerase B [Saprospiraceae bacterium]
MKKIAIGCDHAGVEYKEKIVHDLIEKGYDVKDFGTNDTSSVDYPDFIHPTSEAVEEGECELGIILCGSGNGAAMAANKHKGIRAALCWNSELASLARQHNNANILSIPSRFVSYHVAITMVFVFLETEFEGGRHQRRVDKIPCA